MLQIPIAEVREYLVSNGLDGWLLADFRGQNPTAVRALDLEGKLLTRRWFYLIPADGEPAIVAHTTDVPSFRDVPGRMMEWASWEQLRRTLNELLARRPRVLMEYVPLGAIPTLSRIDAGTLELVIECGGEVESSADLVQYFFCRWDDAHLESHKQAAARIDRIKDEAFAFIGDRFRRGEATTEAEVQRFIGARIEEEGMVTDHAPIVATGANSGNPQYMPDAAAPQAIKRGQIVMIDLWARMKRERTAWADITWIGHMSAEPPADVAKLFDIVVRARETGIEFIRDAFAAGRTVLGWQVDRVVRDFIGAAGYGPYFVHRSGRNLGTGHSIGEGVNLDDLETHDTRPLIPRVGLTLAPGIYLPEHGVRTEVNIYLSEQGPQLFSRRQDKIITILP